jgi:hypothetical protein
MKNIKLILVFLIANTCLGQNTFKNESLGFNIEQPQNWIVAKNGESVENIKNLT